MMPKAGGQYVYLRESLGPLWGFLYGWTLFMVIQTGTLAAVCVAFAKFLGVFFPAVSTNHWLWHIAHVPPVRVGPMVLGNMEIGVNTANLTAIIVAVLLAVVNCFGIRLGALIQNIFTSVKALSLAAWFCWRLRWDGIRRRGRRILGRSSGGMRGGVRCTRWKWAWAGPSCW